MATESPVPGSTQMPSADPLKILLAHGGLLLIALAPVWLTAQPALVDYPNHMARMYLLGNLAHSDILQQFYQVHWSALPNLAMDLLIPWLGMVMPLQSAGKLFVSLTLLLLSSGTAALHYALHRRWSYWPLVAFLFLYNGIFLWGILNYLFGLGLALWILAAWVLSHGRSAWLRLPIFSLLSVLLYFAHLAALGVYALVVLGYEYARQRASLAVTGRRPALMASMPAMTQFAAPALLFLFFVSFSHAASSAAGGSSESPGILVAMLVKLAALFYLSSNYNNLLDAAMLSLFLCLVVLGLAYRRLILNRMMVYALAVLFAAFIMTPFRLLASNFADIRLMVGILFIFLASTDLQLRTRAWASAMATCLLGMFILRMGLVLDRWQEINHSYAGFVQLIDRLPQGARLFTVEQRDKAGGYPFQTPIWHWPCVAIVRKSAFVPTLFASQAAQPVIFTPEGRLWAGNDPEILAAKVSWERVRKNYDFVLVPRIDSSIPSLPGGFDLVQMDGKFALYRIRHAGVDL